MQLRFFNMFCSKTGSQGQFSLLFSPPSFFPLFPSLPFSPFSRPLTCNRSHFIVLIKTRRLGTLFGALKPTIYRDS